MDFKWEKLWSGKKTKDYFKDLIKYKDVYTDLTIHR